MSSKVVDVLELARWFAQNIKPKNAPIIVSGIILNIKGMDVDKAKEILSEAQIKLEKTN